MKSIHIGRNANPEAYAARLSAVIKNRLLNMTDLDKDGLYTVTMETAEKEFIISVKRNDIPVGENIKVGFGKCFDTDIYVGGSGMRSTRVGRSFTPNYETTPEEFADETEKLVIAFKGYEDGRIMPLMPQFRGENINRKEISTEKAEIFRPIAEAISDRLKTLGVVHAGWKAMGSKDKESGYTRVDILFPAEGGYLPFVPSIHSAPAVTVDIIREQRFPWHEAGNTPENVAESWMMNHLNIMMEMAGITDDEEDADNATVHPGR